MAISVGLALPPALRDVAVLDAKGAPHPLGQFIRGTTLLVFLRHYGCIHCSRQVDLLGRRLPELADLGVHVVLIGSGPPASMEDFCLRQSLDERALAAPTEAAGAGPFRNADTRGDAPPLVLVTDPSLAAYRAAEMERSLGSVFTPRSIVEELGTIARGYFPKRVSGDVSQLGGAILVDDAGSVAFRHVSTRPGDLADVADIVDAALRLVAARAAVAYGRV